MGAVQALQVARRRSELTFPEPLRLRVGDRFVFLPCVETAIAWLQASAEAARRFGLEASLELLLIARDSRSPKDLSKGYRAFLESVTRAQLLFR